MPSFKEKIVEFINNQDGPIRRYCHRICAYFERDQAAQENLGAVILLLIGITVPQTWLEAWFTGFMGFMFMVIAVTILGFVPGFIWYTILKMSGSSEKARGIWILCLGLVWYGLWLGAWAFRDTSEQEPITWGFWDNKPAPDVSLLMQWIGDDNADSADDSSVDSNVYSPKTDVEQKPSEHSIKELPTSSNNNHSTDRVPDNQSSQRSIETAEKNENKHEDKNTSDAVLD